jgi:adenylate cyclase
MEFINAVASWLDEHEGVLSAITALAAISAIFYGLLSFLFPGMNRKIKSVLGHAAEQAAGNGASAVPAKPRKPGRSSIAVLPLRTLSSSEEDINIAAGISAEISADLAQLPDLRVASHLATIQFLGKQVDLKQVADVLSVHYVFTGSYQRVGDRMRLNVELTDAETSDQLWASTYDRQLQDLFEVQAEVSRSIVATIGGELKLANTRIAYLAPTQNLDAWGLVQRAFNFWLTRFTPDDFDKSLALLRKAVKLDPEYAGAHASLGMILSIRCINGFSRDIEADRDEALGMIEEAVRLGPKDLTVLQNAGLVWTHHGLAGRAREILRRAVELAPLDLMAWGYLAFNLAWAGEEAEVAESVEILERLLKMSPKHPSLPYWYYFQGGALVRQGRLEEAIKANKRVLELQPAYFLSYLALANLHGLRGDTVEAVAAMQQANAIHPLLTTAFVAEQTRIICTSDAKAEPFLAGLRQAGLLE